MARVGWSAFEEQRKQWNLPAAPEVKLSKCEAYPAGKEGDGKQQQWGWCTWYAPDDMQEITVELHKPGYLDNQDPELKKVIWVVQNVEVNRCEATPSPQ